MEHSTQNHPKAKRWPFHSLFSWRTARRVLITLACLSTLTAIFYTEENWRGKRAWEKCKRELEAKGEVLDWSAYIPPPVPDDQNIFKAPKMQAWFVGRGANELSKRLTNAATSSVGSSNVITNKEAAREYVEWCSQLEPEFNLIRDALKRPYARMDGDYEQPFAIPIPNFVTVRNVAQTLAQRTHCYLLLEQPENALRDLTLLHDLSRLLEGKPTGKPMTLVAAMINVAITGLYVDAVADGIRLRAWRETQFTAIQKQLEEVDLAPLVKVAFMLERVSISHTLEKTPPKEIADQFIALTGGKTNFWQRLRAPFYSFLIFAPRGWVYQNLVTHARLIQPIIDSYDLENQLILPQKAKTAGDEAQKLKRYGPYTCLDAIILPNFVKAWQSLARNQTKANEAFIACTLERYRLAHGNYPETLGALVPQFADKLPHDVIGGHPLKYRRTDNGQFLLYSIGWNETDDGGFEPPSKVGNTHWENGDWVWSQWAN